MKYYFFISLINIFIFSNSVMNCLLVDGFFLSTQGSGTQLAC